MKATAYPPHRILVIGNAAGGKTRLSRKLSDLYDLPLIHVDSIQFLPGLKIRPLGETRKILSEFENKDKWIIDGFGPLDQLESRFQRADKIVFVDLPFSVHLWWFFKRQISSFWRPRSELPLGCNEFSWSHSLKIFRSMRSMNRQMKPELRRILGREGLKTKVILIRNRHEWARVFENGLRRLTDQ